NPVISNGLVFVGSNNEAHYDPSISTDGGNELCFRESDGKFLWQHFNAKLAAGRVNDWPQEGLCATAFIDGDRLYYPTNRCEVWCWDISPLRGDGSGILVQGSGKENDAPIQPSAPTSPEPRTLNPAPAPRELWH